MGKILFIIFLLLLIFNKKFRRVFFTLTIIFCVGTFILAKTDILYTDPETGRRFSDIEAENQSKSAGSSITDSYDINSSSSDTSGISEGSDTSSIVASLGEAAVKQQMQNIISSSTGTSCDIDDYMGG